MKLEVSEQFVREAHKSACKTWKTRIEEEFPSLFEMKLEKGNWYTSERGNLVFYSTDEQENYGLSFHSMVWSNTLSVRDIFTWRLSTKEEIESMLWKEAEKRGIGKDTKIKECLYNTISQNINAFRVEYDEQEDRLWNTNGVIYEKGKWAKPLDPNKDIKETISRLEKELKELKEKVSPTQDIEWLKNKYNHYKLR